MNQTKLEWYLLSIMILVVAVVFWQVYTDMTQAGIASGGAFDNAAAYPRALAIILGILVVFRSSLKFIQKEKHRSAENDKFSFSSIRRPFLLLVFFTLYLFGLKVMGYHLMTPPFLIIVLYFIGERKFPLMLLFGVASSLIVAVVFEVLLKIVLPGGIFRLNIPW